MASDLHVPCFMICSKGTPRLKAQEAPARLNAWKVRGGEILSAIEIFLRCLRATESVRGTCFEGVGSMNNGSFGLATIIWVI